MKQSTEKKRFGCERSTAGQRGTIQARHLVLDDMPAQGLAQTSHLACPARSAGEAVFQHTVRGCALASLLAAERRVIV